MSRRRTLLLALPAALVCAALWPAASQAFVGCEHSAGTLRVFMNQDGDGVTVTRGGDAINVISGGRFDDFPEILLVCSGGDPTVHNTDRIVIDEAAVAGFTIVAFDLSGGQFAPGATPEPDGTSEIELQANMFGFLSFTGVGGTSGDDVIHMGRTASGATGVNFNAGAEAAPDVDLEVTQPELLTVGTGAGNDVFLGRGAPGFAGPLGRGVAMFAAGGRGRDRIVAGASTFIAGGRGNDTLLGSRFADFAAGEGGRDLIKTGRGDDTALTARDGRDRVNCGAGEDTAIADATDREAKCERDKLKRNIGGGEVIIFSAARMLSTAAGRPVPDEMLREALNTLRGK